MGNVLKRIMCPIYPQEDSDSDDDSIHKGLEPLKPSEIMEREYIIKEKKALKQIFCYDHHKLLKSKMKN